MKKNKNIDSNELSGLVNIGDVLEEQLITVGIKTYDDLKRVGAKQAWLKIQEIDKSACINRLYALEGAILGVNKNLMSIEKKVELREFYYWHKL